MTVGKLLHSEAHRLICAHDDNAMLQVRRLFESLTGKSHTQLLLEYDTEVSPETAHQLSQLVSRRIDGEPLQYLLGEWEFMGNSFFVGKGVLIPRPETEMLVQEAVGRLPRDRDTVIYDLCSGSGCIAISTAKLLPEARIYAVELFDTPYEYLERNIAHNCVKNVIPVKADIKLGFEKLSLPQPDAILSNPPYVREDELPMLQREVRHEPVQALSGGEDGLEFYRVLANLWYPHIKSGGFLAAEHGDGQSRAVCELFGKEKCEVLTDISGLERDVIVRKL